MRFVVLLFGLLAIPLTALVGAFFMFNDVGLKMLQDQMPEVEIPDLSSPTGASLADAGLFMLIAAGYGFVGVILSVMRCGWQGALLMIIPVLCTGIMHPYTLGASGLQVFTGLLSFLVFPVPINAPAPQKDNNDEDD